VQHLADRRPITDDRIDRLTSGYSVVGSLVTWTLMTQGPRKIRRQVAPRMELKAVIEFSHGITTWVALNSCCAEWKYGVPDVNIDDVMVS
jgi:hypothetical protein